MKKFLLLLVLLSQLSQLHAQVGQPFTRQSATNTVSSGLQETAGKSRVEVSFDAVAFNAMKVTIPMRLSLSSITNSSAMIDLPLAGGEVLPFHIAEVAILSPEVAAQFPSIKTYDISSADGSITGRVTTGPLGFNAMIVTPEGRQYITPENTNDAISHIVCNVEDQDPLTLHCGAGDLPINLPDLPKMKTTGVLGDCQLRTYRLAISATGEFTAYFGNNQTTAMNSITSTVANISFIYQRDLSIAFTLVSGTSIIYTDPNTDPFATVSFPDANTLIENHNSVTTALGTGNFDLSLVFNWGWFGGLAATPSVCNASFKGRGAGGIGTISPSGSIMENLVAHEIGHMFSTMHTLSSGTGGSCVGSLNLPTSYEPGGGSTIMGYASSVCNSLSYQTNTDGYFHYNSVSTITSYALSQSGCGTTSTLSNTAPTLSVAAPSYDIPKSTPFALTANGSDANGNAITYQFDQYDVAAAAMTVLPASTNATGPLFRSYPPSSSNVRYFPPLSNILANTSPTWEVLPSVGRTLNFRILARDNASGGGCIASESVALTVDGNSGPFQITSHNTTSTLTANGSNTMTITWDVNNTTTAPVSATTVNILFSTDNGVTFPYTLASATANDGTETIIVPNLSTTFGRIKIIPTNNIFFDINNAALTISTTCVANGATFTPSSNVTEVEGAGALNLGLSAAYGSVLAISGSIDVGDPTANLVIGTGSSQTTCAGPYTNQFKYDLYTFQVSVSGNYTFTTTGGTGAAQVVYNLYNGSYAAGCSNFIISNYQGGTNVGSITRSLTAGLTYVLAVGSFDVGFPSVGATYTIGVTPPLGGNIYNGTPPPSGSFSYTFVVVNAAGNIAGFSSIGDLTSVSDYSAGTYTVYGISYSSSITAGTLNSYVGGSFLAFETAMLNSTLCANRSTNSVTVTISPYTWTGASSSNWNTAGNWSPATVPGATNTALIPSTGVSFEPIVVGTLSVKNLIVGSGRTITITSPNTLSVGGTLSNNATVTGAGKIVLNGIAQQSIEGIGTISNLELNNSTGAVIAASNTQSLTDALTLTSGTLSTSGALTLKSSASSSARVAQITSGAITGDVTVETYIPASGNRAWRMLTAPIQTTGAPTIYNSWQESGASTPGFGTHITNAGGAAVANSFDAGMASTASGIRQYNSASNTLTTPSGTNLAVTSQPAWFVFVRGDRSLNITSSSTVNSNTTLRVSGLLKTGNQNFTVPATNYAVVGNPYASPIDFSLAVANASTTNTLTKFWVWDPKLNTTGGYVLFDAGLGYLPSVTGGSYSVANSIIQSGQGFWVQSNGSLGNLRIQEDDKASTHMNVFKTTNPTDPMLRVRLNMTDNSSFIPADGIVGVFNASYSAIVDIEDGQKMTHFGPNIALSRNTELLTIEKRPDPSVTDTLHMAVWNGDAGNYQLEIDASNFTPAMPAPYLLDNYLSTIVPINLNATHTVNFAITTDPLSYGLERFKIVFQNVTPLKNDGLLINAVRHQDGVRVNWTMKKEGYISQYDVERSIDGKSFASISKVPAKENKYESVSYNVLDASPAEGTNYYRIKATQTDNKVIYSPVVRAKTDMSAGSMAVTPNPVNGETINVQFTNMAGGEYKFELFNSIGQIVYKGSLSHSGGYSVYKISTGVSMKAKGIYQLKLGNGHDQFSTQIVSQ